MNIFSIFQIIIAVLLVLAIILQQRGSEAGIAFGGGGGSFRSKRGLERFLYYATVILGILFAANSILTLVFQ